MWMRGRPGLLWWQTPNGGKRSRIEAAIMKGHGVRAGVSDLIAVNESKAFAAGGQADVAEGLDQALRLLESWKLLRGVVS
jgi:hypothetical protein